MSFATDRILDLQALAVQYATKCDDPVLKQNFALWLHNELMWLDDNKLVTEENMVDFMATVKILVERLIPQDISEDA